MKLLMMIDVGENNYAYDKSDEDKIASIKGDLKCLDVDDVEILQVPEDVTLRQVENMLTDKYVAVTRAKYDDTFKGLEKGEDPQLEER